MTADEALSGAAVAPLPYADDSGRATLRTIAELAGVHVSTVSRVLSASLQPGVRAASTKTSERIRQLAAELGYAPNPHATGLRTSRSNLVGVLVPRLTDVVLASIYEGIEESAAENGYQTFVANTGDDPDSRRLRTDMMLARRVDGLILGDSPLDGDHADALRTRKVPYVLTNRRAGNHPSVTCDDRLGGRLVAEHLLALGHKNVGVIAGLPYASTGVDRTEGFLEVFREAGLLVSEDRIVRGGFFVADGRAGAATLLNVSEPPTAIFAVNDYAAVGVLGALREAGLQAGAHVAVVGFNDIEVVAELAVPLTSVRSPMREMGRQAFELLVDQIGGLPPESRLLAPELVVRETSGERRG